jgi:uncharacterized membrane protein YczE
MLIIGLALFGLGEALLIAAGIGVSPWSVLAQGFNQIFDLSIGLATFIISVVVLTLWIPLKQTPGMGTVLNIIIISLVLDLSLPYLPQPDPLALQVIQVAIGVFITGIGSGIYLIAKLGPGPRDGLMTGLQRLTQFPIAWIRSSIEITVVIFGWSLGGVVGIGTLCFALGIGPSMALAMFCFQRYFGK